MMVNCAVFDGTNVFRVKDKKRKQRRRTKKPMMITITYNDILPAQQMYVICGVIWIHFRIFHCVWFPHFWGSCTLNTFQMEKMPCFIQLPSIFRTFRFLPGVPLPLEPIQLYSWARLRYTVCQSQWGGTVRKCLVTNIITFACHSYLMWDHLKKGNK